MKKTAVILAVFLALLGGAWFVLTSVIIDSDDMAQEMRSALESATGRSVWLGEDAEVGLFPPQVTFNGMRVSNIEGASTPDFLTSRAVVMKLDIGKLLAADATPAEIVLDEAEFHFEVIPDGQKNWRFGGEGQQADGFRAYFLNTPVTLENAMVNYVNAATGSRVELGGVSGAVGYKEEGSVVEYNGAVAVQGEPAQLMLRMRSTDLTRDDSAAAPFQFVLQQGGTEFKAQGQLSTVDSEPEFIGTMEASTGNIWNIMGLLGGGKTVEGKSAAPFNAKGNMRFSTRYVRLTEMAVDADAESAIPAIKGVVNMEYRFGEKPYLRLLPQLETVDMDALLKAYAAWLGAQGTADADKPMNPLAAASTEANAYEAFLRVASGAINARIDGLIYQGRSINNIRFNAAMQPGVLGIREGLAHMPGETRMTFAGDLMTKEGVAFDGKFEMQGRKLENFLSLFTPANTEVPPLDLGLFGMRTNVSINDEQFRFSEFQARIAETLTAGSIILHRGDRPKVESYLRVANIDLDVVTEAVKFMLPENEGVKTTSDGPAGAGFDVRYQNTTFDWLNGVSFDVDSDFLINDFVLFERKGKRAEFNLKLGVGSASVNSIDADYNGAQVAGSYGVTVEQGQNPYIQVDTAISELDMVDIFPDLARARNDEEWEAYLDETLELMPLQTYRASVKARIGTLRVRDFRFEKVNTQMTLDNSELTLHNFTGYLWDGGLNARAVIQAGTIPSLSLSFAHEKANLVRMSEANRLFKHAAGRMSVSGQVTTSGVKLRSWYGNAKGELRALGRDISVQGFGISTLARAVPVARQVRDIERARDIALRGGVTRISAIDGIINIEGGKASTPIMNYKSNESQGAVRGSVDLVNETVDLTMQFYLLNTIEEGRTPPQVTLTMQGDIDDVRKELDTQSLENYISQRAAERALGRDR